jgi:hypothetical protein
VYYHTYKKTIKNKYFEKTKFAYKGNTKVEM